jgi:phosphate starvation-inducible protein PhoH
MTTRMTLVLVSLIACGCAHRESKPVDYIVGEWMCEFPGHVPESENTFTFDRDGVVVQKADVAMNASGQAMRARIEQVGSYRVSGATLFARMSRVAVHSLTLNGEPAPAEMAETLEKSMLEGNTTEQSSPIEEIDAQRLVLGTGELFPGADSLKCTR